MTVILVETLELTGLSGTDGGMCFPERAPQDSRASLPSARCRHDLTRRRYQSARPADRRARPLGRDDENPVLSVVLECEEAAEVAGHGLAAWLDGADERDCLVMVLTAGAPPERGAAGGVRSGDPGENGERRCNAREREDWIALLVNDEIGNEEE
jgi:hypothetical protein